MRKARTSPTRKVPMKCLRLRSEQPQMLPAWQPTGSRWLTGSDSLPTARLHSPALPSPKCRFPPFFARPPLANSLNLPVSVALAPSLRAAPGSGADRVGDGAVHHPQPPRRPLLDHELHLPAPAGARAGGGGSWTSKWADCRLRTARASSRPLPGVSGQPPSRRRIPMWARRPGRAVAAATDLDVRLVKQVFSGGPGPGPERAAAGAETRWCQIRGRARICCQRLARH